MIRATITAALGIIIGLTGYFTGLLELMFLGHVYLAAALVIAAFTKPGEKKKVYPPLPSFEEPKEEKVIFNPGDLL